MLFRKQSLSLGRNDIVQLKEAYKWITHPLFSEELGVPIDGKSLFEVSVVFAHPETVEDCHFLRAICPDCFKPAKNKQSVFTRMAVMKALNKIKEEDFLNFVVQYHVWNIAAVKFILFCRQFPCPPNSPKAVCTVLEIECAHGAVFVAGKIFSFNFSSSGREDVDVRTLGNGRPFAIELVNPHRAHFTSQEIKELQQKINNSEAIGHMKEGEEEKTKTYSALIWTNKAIQRKDIEFLDDIKDLKIDQKTPLRVLHRRPLAVRTRIIHSMETHYVDEHHFRLYLKTQAGTYPFTSGSTDLTRTLLGGFMLP
ncbi:putative tRNA pseudouridine synthase Pus10 [Camelus dromedarius]|uniref:tRNA pseudouridine(55) synthase n=1 Tax=Camelus dromedarius TaxID=9838 RepID=A0A5N4D6S4_CAMDR|nr:putative tRNA pseudouridine synthase Pus10 [Camelus dromedarius]